MGLRTTPIGNRQARQRQGEGEIPVRRRGTEAVWQATASPSRRGRRPESASGPARADRPLRVGCRASTLGYYSDDALTKLRDVVGAADWLDVRGGQPLLTVR